MSKTTILKRTILALIAVITAVVLYYVIAYSYLYVYAAFTWQCNIYVGEMSPEGREVCDTFNREGLIKALTK